MSSQPPRPAWLRLTSLPIQPAAPPPAPTPSVFRPTVIPIRPPPPPVPFIVAPINVAPVAAPAPRPVVVNQPRPVTPSLPPPPPPSLPMAPPPQVVAPSVPPPPPSPPRVPPQPVVAPPPPSPIAARYPPLSPPRAPPPQAAPSSPPPSSLMAAPNPQPSPPRAPAPQAVVPSSTPPPQISARYSQPSPPAATPIPAVTPPSPRAPQPSTPKAAPQSPPPVTKSPPPASPIGEATVRNSIDSQFSPRKSPLARNHAPPSPGIIAGSPIQKPVPLAAEVAASNSTLEFSPKNHPLPPQPPPSPFTLPPAATLKSGFSGNEPAIEQKNVLVQRTIDKPMEPLPTPHDQNPTGSSSSSNGKSNSSGKEKNKKKSVMQELGIGVVTIAGENKGAIMELGHKKENKIGHHHRHEHHTLGGKEGNSTEKKGKSMGIQTPVTSVLNSNIQGLNNSLMYNCAFSNNDPGIHISLRRSSNGRHSKE